MNLFLSRIKSGVAYYGKYESDYKDKVENLMSVAVGYILATIIKTDVVVLMSSCASYGMSYPKCLRKQRIIPMTTMIMNLLTLKYLND